MKNGGFSLFIGLGVGIALSTALENWIIGMTIGIGAAIVFYLGFRNRKIDGKINR